jgi:hypothetical protein
VGSFSFLFLFLAQVGPGPLSTLLNFGFLSALARCRPILKFGSLSAPGPLSAHYGVWPVVSPFGSAFTSHLALLLAACQPLSSPTASTIYKPFHAFATAIIIVSNFKLKVAEYSTLSLRGMLEYIIL